MISLVNNSCYIRVSNYGGFIIRFSLIYTDVQGKTYKKITEQFYLGGTRRIDYPCNATNLQFSIEAQLSRGTFNVIYATVLLYSGRNCYTVKGVTSNPIITEYQCPEYDSYMQVDCNGAFVTRFFMTYVTDKKDVVTLSSGGFTAGISRTLYYPPNIVSVELVIQIAVFIGVFSDVYINTFNTLARRCFRTTGTLFNPKVTQFECYE